MALSFGTRIKFLLGHIWLSISSKVIRGPSSLVLPSLPSLVSILLPMVFNKSVFAPTRASLGVYTNSLKGEKSWTQEGSSWGATFHSIKL